MQDSDQRRIDGILFSNLQLTVKIGEGEFGMSTESRKKVDAALLLTAERRAMANPPYHVMVLDPLSSVTSGGRNDISERAGNHKVTLRWSVKLCDAKTESVGTPVLVKMYEAGDPLGI
ncbi:hypothetical protein BU17DRAFT_60077 [Hysterangium stoloniferum]|nr:hypothetical protein BU17DRAFT_60077 [Hysterangium stoloniferum]